MRRRTASCPDLGQRVVVRRPRIARPPLGERRADRLPGRTGVGVGRGSKQPFPVLYPCSRLDVDDEVDVDRCPKPCVIRRGAGRTPRYRPFVGERVRRPRRAIRCLRASPAVDRFGCRTLRDRPSCPPISSQRISQPLSLAEGIPRAAMSPATSGGRTVESVPEEDF